MKHFSINFIHNLLDAGYSKQAYNKLLEKFNRDAEIFFEKFKKEYGIPAYGNIMFTSEVLERECKKYFSYIEKNFIFENILEFVRYKGAEKQGGYFWIEA